jgi:glucosamine--fructose-6-phosphate aminotransferase (isomerizing)
MCGIVGFIRSRRATEKASRGVDIWELLLTGLRRLEYRGYDSWGVAGVASPEAMPALARKGNGSNGHSLHGSARIVMHREAGRITTQSVPPALAKTRVNVGLAHTRWATHGAPTEKNAHPHLGGKRDEIAIVHNGIIENHADLRRHLRQKGVEFRSETDSEVLAHLIAQYDQGDLLDAVREALALVEGAYGLAVISSNHPAQLVGARRGSPLLVGQGADGAMIASDPNAMIATGGRFVPLNDGEVVLLDPDGFRIERLEDRVRVEREIEHIELQEDSLHSGGYETFMAKEIHEQPESLRNCLRGRLNFAESNVKLGGPNITAKEARKIQHIVLLGMGTSWHAGLVGRLLFEELAGIPTTVDYSAEFRYRNPVLHPNTLVIAISQSGETADTLAALQEAKRRGASILGVCNVVGSTIARECGRGVYLHAGPEIGVASTKAFTCQIAALAMLAIMLGRHRNLSSRVADEYLQALGALPDQIQQILTDRERVREQALLLAKHANFLYIGRGAQYPVALEGALKLKEISYRHAEGIPAAELKHGPIALVDEQMPVVVLAPEGRVLTKMISNIEEIKARKGRLLGIVTRDNRSMDGLLDWRLEVPSAPELIEPILTVIPLQIFAHDLARHLGRDVDRPRNLAKSVTVE